MLPLLWSSNSPDLNPVDYRIKVSKNFRVTDLGSNVASEPIKLEYAVIAAAVHQWRRRLSACVRAGGGHFEHCF